MRKFTLPTILVLSGVLFAGLPIIGQEPAPGQEQEEGQIPGQQPEQFPEQEEQFPGQQEEQFPEQQQQSGMEAEAQGKQQHFTAEVMEVNPEDQTITVRMKLKYDENTLVTGSENSIEALSGQTGAQLFVHTKEEKEGAEALPGEETHLYATQIEVRSTAGQQPLEGQQEIPGQTPEEQPGEFPQGPESETEPVEPVEPVEPR